MVFNGAVSCTEQSEGGDSAADSQIDAGGSTVSNVKTGPKQIEGFHYQSACTLTNAERSTVCEDAFTLKNPEAGATTKIAEGDTLWLLTRRYNTTEPTISLSPTLL